MKNSFICEKKKLHTCFYGNQKKQQQFLNITIDIF